MYENIGGKIKSLAKVSFIVATSLFVLSGIIFLLSAENASYRYEDTLITYGVLLPILGPLFSWIGTWLLYGFGELIEKVSDIEYNTRGTERKSTEYSISEQKKISNIEKLHVKGLITDEEYEQAISKYE